MMKTVYMYVQDTMADWEHGYLMQALSLQTMLKKPKVSFKTVGRTKAPVRTASGMTLVPDLSLDDIDVASIAALVLIGGETWLDEEQAAILNLATKLLREGFLVAAICGATMELADQHSEIYLTLGWHPTELGLTTNKAFFIAILLSKYKLPLYYKVFRL